MIQTESVAVGQYERNRRTANRENDVSPPVRNSWTGIWQVPETAVPETVS